MYISSRTIVGNILRNFGLEQSGMEADMFELIDEAVQWLGNRHLTFKRGLTKAKVENHQLVQDFDCPAIIHIFSESGTPFRNGNRVIESNEAFSLESRPNMYVDQFNHLYPTINYGCEWWDYNGDQIELSLEKGTVWLYHKQQIIDKYPVVLDNFNYIKAVEYYVMKMLMERGHDPNNKNLSFNYVFNEATKYKLRCKNRLLFPQPYEMDKFVELWTGIRVP